MSEIGKFIDLESNLQGLRAGGGDDNGDRLLNGLGFSFGAENAL